MEGGEGEGLGLHGGGIEEVAEVAQAAFGTDDTVEGFEHRAVGGLVEEELDAEVFGGLEVDERGVVGEGDNHAIAIDKAHRGSEGKVFNLRTLITPRTLISLSREEGHGAAEFEIVFDVVVIGLAEEFDDKLIEGVVVGLARFEGEPDIAALDLPLQTHGLGLFAVGLFLSGVFHLEEQALLLKCQNRRTLLISHRFGCKVTKKKRIIHYSLFTIH